MPEQGVLVGGLGHLELVFSIQRQASLAGFGNVFPPERYPYPDGPARGELRTALANPANTLLIDRRGPGFALVGDGWLHKLYVVQAAWGTGVARALHDAALDALRAGGARTASLWTLAENGRGRRFYEKHGWRPDGRERVVRFPPHPLDIGYSIDL